MRALLLSLLSCFMAIVPPLFAQSQPSEELFIPILINGVVGDSSHYQTVFRFVELSGTTASPAVTVTFEAFENAGNPIAFYDLFCWGGSPPVLHPERFNLPGNGSVHFGTAATVGFPPPNLLDGWVRLTLTGAGKLQATAEVFDVAGLPPACPAVPICRRPSDLYKSDAVVQAMRPAKVFRAATVITPYRETAFSVVNPSAIDTAHVFIELLRNDGSLLERGLEVDIPPMQRYSAFAWEWADTSLSGAIGVPVLVPDSFYGSARIVSDVPVVVGALQVLFPEGKLVSTLVTPEP